MVLSLAEMHPSLAREWSDRNLPLCPEEISEKSRSNVWWKGSCGHEWSDKIYNRAIHKKGCKRCEAEMSLDDIRELFPEVEADIDRYMQKTP